MQKTQLQISRWLEIEELTVGFVESATGGLISSMMTNVPGSSVYYKGSLICYSNKLKNKLAGVKTETLEKFGAVSAEVAVEMALGGREVLEIDICLADTGIAGPGGGSQDKPVGLAYIAVADKCGTVTRRIMSHGTRRENKTRFATEALQMLHDYLASLHNVNL